MDFKVNGSFSTSPLRPKRGNGSSSMSSEPRRAQLFVAKVRDLPRALQLAGLGSAVVDF